IVVQRIIGRPYVNSDPLSTPVPQAAQACPVDQCLTDSEAGMAAADDQPGHVDGTLASLAKGPEPRIAGRPVGDGGDGCPLLLDYPCLPVAEAPADALVPGRPAGPGPGPLVGLLVLQPSGRFVDHGQDELEVVRRAAADLEVLCHGSGRGR